MTGGIISIKSYKKLLPAPNKLGSKAPSEPVWMKNTMFQIQTAENITDFMGREKIINP